MPVGHHSIVDPESTLLPFTFFWFAESEHLSLYISVSLTANQFDSETLFPREFQLVMVILLLGLPFEVTRLCSIGQRDNRFDNVFDVLSSWVS